MMCQIELYGFQDSLLPLFHGWNIAGKHASKDQSQMTRLGHRMNGCRYDGG